MDKPTAVISAIGFIVVSLLILYFVIKEVLNQMRNNKPHS